MDLAYHVDKKAIATYPDGTTLKIPSQRYPLNSKIKVFTSNNTFELNDSVIEDVFNSFTPKVGMCYTNSKVLSYLLQQNGIEKSRIKTYVGWLFLGQGIPVHHCMVVIDDKHVLDYTVFKFFGNVKKFPNVMTMDVMRQKVSRTILAERDRKNSEAVVFGQAIPETIYVMSECDPDEGIKIRNSVKRAFPKHPGFNNVKDNGLTETQQIYYEKEKAQTK